MAKSLAFDNQKYRFNPSTMIKTSQTTLALLRPERLDDVAIKDQIALIQQTCGGIDADLVAVVFHECDYHLSNTIARIQAGAAVEDGGWQKAKTTNKKKINQQANSNEPMQTSDGDKVTAQQISSRSAANLNHRRVDQHQYHSSARTYPNRRRHGNAPFGSAPRFRGRYLSKQKSSTLTVPLTSTELNHVATKGQSSPNSSSNDEFEFLAQATQSLTFDNSSKKIIVPSKRPTPSSIPQQPVAMHPTVQFSSASIDIQFGDVQWNDSIPVAVTPSEIELETQPTSNVHDQTIDKRENSSKTEVKNLVSSEIISSNSHINSMTMTSTADGVSNLSDPSNNTTKEQQAAASAVILPSSSNITTRAPISSTANFPEYSPSTNQSANNLQSQPDLNGYPSAFTPYSTAQTVYPPTQREYSSSKSPWASPATLPTGIYKTIPASNMPPLGPGYGQPQPAYTLPSQQQYLLGTYSYPTPAVYQLFAATDSWSAPGYQPTMDSYPTYPNYYSTYPTAQQYHSHAVPTTKYNQYSIYDRDPNLTYGQARSTTNDLTNSTQSTKDVVSTSTLSATAATYSQGVPLTTTNTAGTFIINSVPYSMPPYMSYSTIDSRDNRSGAPYGSQTNRVSYQQQRFHYPRSSWQS